MNYYDISEEELSRLAQEIREHLMDEYGTACGLFPAAQADLIRIENMSDEEIIEEARHLGMI